MENSCNENHDEPIPIGEEIHDEPIAMGKIFNLQKLYLNGDATNVVYPGQTYDLTFELVNKSDNALQNLQASLTLNADSNYSASVQITPDRVLLPPVDPGERVVSGHFTLKVLSDIYLPIKGSQNNLKDLYGYIGFSLKIYQESPNPDIQESPNPGIQEFANLGIQEPPNPDGPVLEILAAQLLFPSLEIVSSSFAISDPEPNPINAQAASLIVFIKIMNHGADLSFPKAQLIIDGIGSTKDNLAIANIRGNEKRQELYGILLDSSAFAANSPLNQAGLKGCLKITSPRGPITLQLVPPIPVPFISICVMQSNVNEIIFEEGVDVDLIHDGQSVPAASTLTDENGGASFTAGEVGLANTVKLLLRHGSISGTLPVSFTTKHHHTFRAALTASKRIQRLDIINAGIKSCA